MFPAFHRPPLNDMLNYTNFQKTDAILNLFFELPAIFIYFFRFKVQFDPFINSNSQKHILCHPENDTSPCWFYLPWLHWPPPPAKHASALPIPGTGQNLPCAIQIILLYRLRKNAASTCRPENTQMILRILSLNTHQPGFTLPPFQKNSESEFT